MIVSDYPPLTQSDERSDLYWRLVKAHELAQLQRLNHLVRTGQSEKTVPLPAELRICPICKVAELPKHKPEQVYCSYLCRNQALKMRSAASAGRR